MKHESFEPSGSFFMPIKNILSLFNGISGLHLALDRAGIEIDTCYYAEIDKYANKITEQQYPDDVALGDVTKWREWDIDWASIDLVGAGFPCQAWSVAGKQLGDKDERGMLFWTTLEIIAHVLKHNPKAKFLMENVKMKKDFEQYITHHTEQALGRVEKTLINSALVSAQNRQRYYWTNFEVTQPEDKGLLLKDVLGDLPINKAMPKNTKFKKNYAQWDLNNKGNKSQDQRAFYINGKHGTLPANGGGSKVKVVCNVNPSGRGMNGNVYDADSDKSPTLTTNKGEGIKITGGAIRGCYLVDGKRQLVFGATYNRKDGLGKELDKSLTICAGDWRGLNRNQNQTAIVYHPASIVGRRLNDRGVRDDYNKDVAITQCLQVKHKNEKTGCLTTVDKDNVLSTEPPGRYPDIYNRCDISYRKLTPLECERLQTFPDNWTDCVSNTQRYKALGNAWTVDVIAHILQCGFKS